MTDIISKKVTVYMSRSKKSRKPGGAPTAKPKLSKQELATVEKRIRKSTGKVAGNRQKEAMQDQADNKQQSGNKDPRLGNKTPIVLGKVVAKQDKPKQLKTKQNSDKSSAIASVRFVEDTVVELSAEQEIDAIEQDELLQNILAKQEDDIELTEQEVDYYNEKMERHQVLSAELGLDEDEDTNDNDLSTGSDSEDELWDKLDRLDFSDFEEKE
jgi:ribosome assembly protein YihI (activator of Der GTPase)